VVSSPVLVAVVERDDAKRLAAKQPSRKRA